MRFLLIILSGFLSTTYGLEIAFGIMTYQKEGVSAEHTFAEFSRLMENIYDKNNNNKHVYVLHTDAKSDPGLISATNREYCAKKVNCGYITPRNVAWGSLSTVEMMLALMQRADQFYQQDDNQEEENEDEEVTKRSNDWKEKETGNNNDNNINLSTSNSSTFTFTSLSSSHTSMSHPTSSLRHTHTSTKTRTTWDYFILLGHESFPLTSLTFVESFLESQPRGSNFVNCWDVNGYDFFGQWEVNTYRLEVTIIYIY